MAQAMLPPPPAANPATVAAAAAREALHTVLPDMESQMADFLSRRLLSAHRGRYMFEGAMMTLALLALAAWVLHDYWRRWTRLRQQGDVAVTLREMEPQRLRQVLNEAKVEYLPAWLHFPDWERVAWINAVVRQLWPHACEAVTQMVHDQVDPLLATNKPRWISDIHMHEFALGPEPPQVSGIKVYQSDRLHDEVVIEMDAVWSGQQNIQLTVLPFPSQLPLGLLGETLTSLILRYVHKFVFLRAGVADLQFSGRVRVALTNIASKVPVVGSVQVSLVDVPDFTFNLTLYGGNLMIVPGLEAFLQSFIRNVLLKPYVLPEAVTIPLVPGGKPGYQRPQGVLFVKLIEATNVPRTDWFTLVDPFVKLYVREKKQKGSGIAYNTRCPRWDQDFQFLVHFPEHQALTADLYDYDRFRNPGFVGRVAIPVTAMEPGRTYDRWFAVRRPAKAGRSSARRHMSQDAVSLQVAGGEPGGGDAADDDRSGTQEQASGSGASGDGPENNGVAEKGSGGKDSGGHGAGSLGGSADGGSADGEVGGPSSRGASSEEQGRAEGGIGGSGGGSGGGGAGAGGSDRPESVEDMAVAPGRCADLTARDDDQFETEDEGSEEVVSHKFFFSRQKQPCKVHMEVTYFQIGREVLEAAEKGGGGLPPALADASGEGRSESQARRAHVVDLLRGGVLQVTVKKPWAAQDSGILYAKQVLVRLGRKERRTAAAQGKPDVTEDETFEFMVSGKQVDQRHLAVEVEVFDFHWVSASPEENLTWGPVAGERRFPRQAVVRIPLREAMVAETLTRSYVLEGLGMGRPELELSLKWLAILESGG